MERVTGNQTRSEPTIDELENLIEWLDKTLEPQAQRLAVRAAAEEARCRLQRGQAAGLLDVETIADRAGAPGEGTDAARRWVNKQNPVQLLTSRLEQQKSWLREEAPSATHALTLIEHGSVGGRGNRKTYEFLRVPIEASSEVAPELEAHAVERQAPPDLRATIDRQRQLAVMVVQYEMARCPPDAMTFWGRLVFRHGGVERGSWRWWLLAMRFVMQVLVAGVMIAIGILLPLIGVGKLGIGVIACVIAVVAAAYWLDIRPWLLVVDDRIRMAGNGLIKDVRPAQLEIWRDGSISTWRLVRYTAVCPICASTIEIQPGEPDFPRRLVGRCAESPREHVFSFDRITRRGRVLISPDVSM